MTHKKKDVQAVLDTLPLPEGEPFAGETLRADGWVCRDTPALLSADMWELFLSIMGEENYRILAMTHLEKSDGDWYRGQFFISPTGIKNLMEWRPPSKQH